MKRVRRESIDGRICLAEKVSSAIMLPFTEVSCHDHADDFAEHKQAHTSECVPPHSQKTRLTMNGNDGHFQVIVLGTGLTESIAAAYVAYGAPEAIS